ncbi:MAG: hypothetical protein ABI680_09450 [Chthoniobacteraceae bacterium]
MSTPNRQFDHEKIEMLFRIGSMLFKLVTRYEQQEKVDERGRAGGTDSC